MEWISIWWQKSAAGKAAREKYFRQSRESIASQNLQFLQMLSAATLLFVCFFLVFTPYVRPTWHPLIYHWLMLSAVAIYLPISHFLQKKKAGYRTVNMACMACTLTITGLLIAVDTLTNAAAPCAFIPSVLVAVPALFIFPAWENFLYITGSALAFAMMAYRFKTAEMAAADSFSALVGMVFGLTVYWVVIQLRAKDSNEKTDFYMRSRTDLLTGLLNKTACEQAAQEYLHQRSENEPCTLMILDLDDFKAVNDTLGHQAGDVLLKAVGVALRQLFRSNDLIGRFGGDEFMLLLKGAADEDLVRNRCDAIQRMVYERMNVGSTEGFSCSIGAAMLPCGTADYAELFAMADEALYKAKAAGKKRYVLHSYSVGQPGGRRKKLLIVDDDSISRKLLRNMFQGEYDLAEAKDGQEALEVLKSQADTVDLILLDIRLPRLNGFEVLEHLRAHAGPQHIPVVAISADADTEEEALRRGAADMLVKPFDAAVARMRVENVLQRWAHNGT